MNKAVDAAAIAGATGTAADTGAFSRWARALGRFVRRIAAVDETLIATCPNSDRIWATQIGSALALTFVILATTSYLSFDYINASSVNFDPRSQSFELVTNRKDPAVVAIGAAIAMVIASIIFLFDRAIYQSDWFYQRKYDGPDPVRQKAGLTDYGPASIWNAIRRVSPKIGRVGIRLAISLLVASCLSQFLELRIFESLILNQMQKEHVQENRQGYEQLSQQVLAVDSDIKDRQKSVATLQVELAALMDPRRIEQESIREQGNDRLTELTREVDSRIAQIDAAERTAVAELEENRLRYEAAVEEGNKRITDLKTRINAEVYGNPENIPGISGLVSCKQRCEYYKAQLRSEEQLQDGRRGELAKIDKAVAAVRQEYEQRRSSARDESAAQRGAEMTRQDDLRRALSARTSELLERNRAAVEALKARIAQEDEALSAAIAGRDAKVAALKDALVRSPEFIQFRDGPLDRLKALHQLGDDPKYGSTINRFAVFVIAFRRGQHRRGRRRNAQVAFAER